MSRFLVLTSTSGVDDAVVQEAINATNGSANRLSDRAVEVGFSGNCDIPQFDGIDANVVMADNRRKKLFIADMDSTMIPVECIDELADFAGVKERVADITERAMQGELNFEEAINERVSLLKDLPETALQQCYEERISLNPGARTLVQTMNAIGAVTALVSGGFLFFTSRVAEDCGFQINRANTLLIDDGKLTGKVGMPILGQQAKLETLNELCAKGGFEPKDVIAVGDGANDAKMIMAAGIGVAFRAKPALKSVADVTLDHSDLTALLSLQGIPESEFSHS